VADDRSWLRVERGCIAVVVNLGPEDQCVPCPAGRILLASPGDLAGSLTAGAIDLPVDAVAIVELA
jgi:hypothetical protein